MKANNEEPVQASASEAQIERPPAQEEAKPDPWGIRRAEVLLTSLKGVLSARVVAAATGEITEVHVRKISVAQTAEILPIEAMEDRAALDRARKRGVVFRRVEVTPTTPHRVTVTVTMERDGQELVAQENAGDADKMRLAAAARATVSILDGLTTTGTIDLAGARLVDAFDTRLAFVGIHVLEGREVRLHVGTCEVKGGVEQAGTLAVLDATNRWLTTTL